MPLAPTLLTTSFSFLPAGLVQSVYYLSSAWRCCWCCSSQQEEKRRLFCVCWPVASACLLHRPAKVAVNKQLSLSFIWIIKGCLMWMWTERSVRFKKAKLKSFASYIPTLFLEFSYTTTLIFRFSYISIFNSEFFYIPIFNLLFC